MKVTNTVLDQIIASKRQRLDALKAQISLNAVRTQAETVAGNPQADFYAALKAASIKPKIIAEAKKASPSAGVLNTTFSIRDINEAYQAQPHIVAISVITEQDHFQGSGDNLHYFAQNNTNNKPLLRKDFIFDPYQIYESKVLGAHAYLLIASLLESSELQELVALGVSLGLEPLVEVHTSTELGLAVASQTRCIGANARNLKTFQVESRVHELLRELDDSYVRVAESGIHSKQQLEYVSSFCDSALIGTEFMQAPNMSRAIEALL